MNLNLGVAMLTRCLLVLASLLVASPAPAAPATKPADADVDWLLGQGKAPAAPKKEAPTSQPFKPANDPDVRKGTVYLSNGENVHGKLSHTREKPIRVWVEADKEYHDIPFKLIASFDAKVSSEYDEKEWHFKESGSDIKEFTGKSYPVRETLYTLTLINGQTITGGILEPIYAERPEGPYTFSLIKRDKGKVGQTLKDLVYVKRVEFDDAMKPTMGKDAK